MVKMHTLLLFVIVFTGSVFAQDTHAQDDNNALITSGYFVREGNDSDLAELSGANQYIRFFSKNRIVRLYIPYPYSAEVSADAIRKVFESVSAQTTKSAYIRGDFGILDEAIVAHIDKVKTIDGRVMFDCSLSAPCEIIFSDNEMIIMNPGIVKKLEVHYRLVPD
ncbi:MAG: hypothetical protein DHS20C01_09860 [marine bacterium B5-7]|nr:MAG: hypothetical protein DHS20C01_09860 [marine bacterium B5-7]